MGLEDWNFVFNSSPNSIVSAHDFFQLVEVLKQMNSNSSVKTSGFQQPEVLSVVHASTELILRFDCFLPSNLHLLELLIDSFKILLDILVDKFENI